MDGFSGSLLLTPNTTPTDSILVCNRKGYTDTERLFIINTGAFLHDSNQNKVVLNDALNKHRLNRIEKAIVRDKVAKYKKTMGYPWQMRLFSLMTWRSCYEIVLGKQGYLQCTEQSSGFNIELSPLTKCSVLAKIFQPQLIDLLIIPYVVRSIVGLLLMVFFFIAAKNQAQNWLEASKNELNRSIQESVTEEAVTQLKNTLKLQGRQKVENTLSESDDTSLLSENDDDEKCFDKGSNVLQSARVVHFDDEVTVHKTFKSVAGGHRRSPDFANKIGQIVNRCASICIRSVIDKATGNITDRLFYGSNYNTDNVDFLTDADDVDANSDQALNTKNQGILIVQHGTSVRINSKRELVIEVTLTLFKQSANITTSSYHSFKTSTPLEHYSQGSDKQLSKWEKALAQWNTLNKTPEKNITRMIITHWMKYQN